MTIQLPDHRQLFPAVGLYLHFPFCARKCLYCDFPSFAGQDHQMEAYVAALCAEIAGAPAVSLRSLFLGGGTPSYLPLDGMQRVLDAVRSRFDWSDQVEATMEANPGNERLTDASAVDTWQRYRAMGINRVSLGVQSFDAEMLQALGRIHAPEDAEAAVRALRQAGFDNISIDLMYGLPGQTLAIWRRTLERAIALELPHLSAYSLIVEPHTPFETAARQGRLNLPSEGVEREMADLAEALLGRAGYRQYEVSNWAQPGRESVHNRVYWHNESWLGLGSGAHSYFERRRWANPAAIATYLAQGPATPPEEPQTLQEELEDTMFMGLRLTQEGVSEARFSARFGVSLASRYGPLLNDLVARDLVSWDGQILRLTRTGLPLANEVFAAFLGA
ncbi:MAG: radical SAM family heme chaperone HemW [Candidatus Sericytochromatia bacterium]|nr:radical SAM family heme chaperone HemW [Candidatus Sericytochromatia bacterium]